MQVKVIVSSCETTTLQKSPLLLCLLAPKLNERLRLDRLEDEGDVGAGQQLKKTRRSQPRLAAAGAATSKVKKNKCERT